MPVPIELSADELRHAGRVADALAAHALASWLPTRRWFASKSRRIRTVAADDAFDLSRGDAMSAALALVRVEYDDGGPIERYVIPFAVAGADDPPTSAGLASDHVIATIASARAIVHDRIGDAVRPNRDGAATVGKDIAEKAKAKNIEACVFDRNGYLYHGKIKALADGAREGGLKF